MKVSQIYSIARCELDRIGVRDAESEARFITSWVCGIPAGYVAIAEETEIEGIEDRLGEVLSRRRKREPLQLILGRWDFFGREFFLDSGVLVPRQETEVLIGAALSRLEGMREREVMGLEVGSGSGVICVTLLSEMENIRMVAVDISERAVAVTEKNAGFHGVSERLRVCCDDFRSVPGDIKGGYDFIISNPPYLSKRDFMQAMPEVKDYEPEEALVAGETGLEAIEDIVRISGGCLIPGGFLFFEFGFGQKTRVIEIIESDGTFEECEIISDLARIPRVAAVRRKGERTG